jgi:pyruvate dehydrogenase E1 component alpha subunit
VEAEVQVEIKAAEERWAQLMEKALDPLEMFDHAYAAMPPHLVVQREELRHELADLKKAEPAVSTKHPSQESHNG